MRLPHARGHFQNGPARPSERLRTRWPGHPGQRLPARNGGCSAYLGLMSRGMSSNRRFVENVGGVGAQSSVRVSWMPPTSEEQTL